jgi:clan AA aspartic protease (TIGR02281 family)
MIRAALSALVLLAMPAMAQPRLEPVSQAVPLEPFNGAYVVPVLLNGVLTEKFIVDSGAADVSIPVEVASRLKALGALKPGDLMGSKIYQMADGSRVASDIYRISSITIGRSVVHDVTVRISGEGSHLLLGQSFLSRLNSWSMDNTRKVMAFN